MPAILIPAVAFLLGSIPSGYLFYRWRHGQDIRREGSGNIGATNVMRRAGARLGLLTLFCDAAKGWLAVWLAAHWLHLPAPPMPYAPAQLSAAWYWLAAAVLLALAGHIFTPWLKFQGGKGVATGLGVFLALAPRAVAWTLVLFVLIVAVSRYISLASMLASLLLPGLMALTYGRAYPAVIYAAAAAAAVLIVIRHGANLRRLLTGTEHRFSWRRGGASPAAASRQPPASS